MAGANRKPNAIERRQSSRPEFVAAVRYPDGRHELFHVRHAASLAEARELVALEVGDVMSLLVAERH